MKAVLLQIHLHATEELGEVVFILWKMKIQEVLCKEQLASNAAVFKMGFGLSFISCFF